MDKQYHILINKDKKKNIYLSVENIKEHMKYEIHINEISPFWLKNMKYFQHDFDNFYRILDFKRKTKMLPLIDNTTYNHSFEFRMNHFIEKNQFLTQKWA